MDIIESYWQEFLSATGRPKEIRYLEAFHFDLTEKSADELLELVLTGVKRATSSSALYFEVRNERMPQPGDLSVVTNWAMEPKCVIETTAVTVLPFKDITFELCRREGEDDTLESWLCGHRSFFTREGALEGYTFSEEMPVVFEDFALVYR